MSADSSAHSASQDPSLGRRALITGAAVLGAASVANIANASDAGAADGGTMKLGRRNDCDSRTAIYTNSSFEVNSNVNTAIAATSRGAVDRFGWGALTAVALGEGTPAVFAEANRGTGVDARGTTRGAVARASRAAGIGLEGLAESTGGTGVKGVGDGVGVDGRGGMGVRGTSTASVGVKGVSTSGTGGEGTTTSGAQAVLGAHPATTGNATGVKGTSASATGVGVMGVASHASGVTQGVRGDGTASPLGTGVTGLGQANGVYGESRKVGGKGVFGLATQADGTASHGVYGQTASTAGAGVYGKSPSYDPDLAWNVTSYGVYAEGAIASSGPAFLGVPEYGTTARSDSRLQEGTMTFSADFTTGSPKLIVLVKNTDGRLFKAELPLTAS